MKISGSEVIAIVLFSRADLGEHMAKFGLKLREEKTRRRANG
jgi:hypothetical protein